MAASDVEVRAIRADERADWEPLWKGYQAATPYPHNPFAMLTFSRSRQDKPRESGVFLLR
jgi:hypothetical protein